MNRRRFLKASLAAAVLPVGQGYGQGAEQASIPVADMHFHLFFFGPKPATSRALGREMADAKAMLAAWALVGDVPWLGRGPRGFVQKGAPTRAEAAAWFDAELDRIKRYVAAQGLKIVRTPADVDLALGGEPHIVLAVEGATFLDGDNDGLGRLKAAYEAGIRQVQLVHYIKNDIGDFQTERPAHGGLTPFGRRVVEECNRLGILVDLAHGTPAAVAGALEASKAPLVWSHSSVVTDSARGCCSPHWSMTGWKARQLPLDLARAIAGKGGVVGLWGVRSDVGETLEAYASRLSQMADWLGEDHVGFGSDMNGIVNPLIAGFADLQGVVRQCQKRGMGDERLRKIAIGNYARVLKQALTPAPG